MPKKPPVEDVTDYIAQSVPDAQPLLNELRSVIKESLPKAEEKISWGQPFYIFDEKKISFARYKAHVSFTISDDLPEKIKNEAEQKGYDTGQKRINIRFDQVIPVDLIRETLKLMFS